MNQEHTKICLICHKEKPLEQLIKNSHCKYGRQRRCKECASQNMKRYWKTYRPTKTKEQLANHLALMKKLYHKKKIGTPGWFENERIRKRLEKRIAIENNREKFRARARAYYKIKKAKGYKHKVNPVKQKARTLMSNAIAKGTLKRPLECSKCGSSKNKIHGHHHDYSLPLDVKWLCSICHGKEHRK